MIIFPISLEFRFLFNNSGEVGIDKMKKKYFSQIFFSPDQLKIFLERIISFKNIN